MEPQPSTAPGSAAPLSGRSSQSSDLACSCVRSPWLVAMSIVLTMGGRPDSGTSRVFWALQAPRPRCPSSGAARRSTSSSNPSRWWPTEARIRTEKAFRTKTAFCSRPMKQTSSSRTRCPRTISGKAGREGPSASARRHVLETGLNSRASSADAGGKSPIPPSAPSATSPGRSRTTSPPSRRASETGCRRRRECA